MKRSEMLTGLVMAGLLTLACFGETSQNDLASSEEIHLSQRETENELVEAMASILERFPSANKRGIPQCAMGSRCAMRMGPRFGQLCECRKGTNCNSFLLKCIQS
ncbi:hypothetical protein DNTS_018026 [Danionella cerebrum]|uniref:Uncharacterized protein n=1 Tax=Danionella cerebrum TaxID=2873325 RepID=A0A553NK99_9TELE|nr:hypothetical protein DNTS_018026 [Danionella translucida]